MRTYIFRRTEEDAGSLRGLPLSRRELAEIKASDVHQDQEVEFVHWTFTKMVETFGKDVAEEMRDRKLNDPSLAETETRKHPELPHREDWRSSKLIQVNLNLNC